MSDGKIAWSPDGTDNWQSGCTEARYTDGRMREECTRCYARNMSARLREMGQPRYADATTGNGASARWTGKLTWDRLAMCRAFDRLGPGKRRFFGSMTDLWHDDCDLEMHAALAAAVANMRGVGMFLTKRPWNLLTWQRHYFPNGLPRRMWVGVSAGNQRAWEAMLPAFSELLLNPNGVAFVSVEPMTGPVDLGSFLCYCPPHAVHQAQREQDLRSRDAWRDGDRRGGADLAYGEARTGSVVGEASHEAVRADQSREGGAIGLPLSEGYDRRAAVHWHGASSRNEAPARPITDGYGGQPQERNQVGQQAGQPGARHTVGECPTCGQHVKGWARLQPERNTQLDGDPDIGTSSGNQASAGIWGESGVNRKGLFDRVSDGIENRAHGIENFWVICGCESRSGRPGAPMDLDWVRSLRDQTREAGASFFFKQAVVNGRVVDTPELDGRTWTEVPDV